jgi:hypothetical protein
MLADELMKTIERVATEYAVSSDVTAKPLRTSQSTQDFGASLLVLLGGPAAVALAKGVHDFIALNGSRVTIATENGSVVATGDAAKNINIADTVRALESRG